MIKTSMVPKSGVYYEYTRGGGSSRRCRDRRLPEWKVYILAALGGQRGEGQALGHPAPGPA